MYILIHAFFLCVYLFTHFFFAFVCTRIFSLRLCMHFFLCAHKGLCCNIYTLCLYHVLLYDCHTIVISHIYTDLSQFEPNCWSQILPRRYFVSKKKKNGLFFASNRWFSMQNWNVVIFKQATFTWGLAFQIFNILSIILINLPNKCQLFIDILLLLNVA